MIYYTPEEINCEKCNETKSHDNFDNVKKLVNFSNNDPSCRGNQVTMDDAIQEGVSCDKCIKEEIDKENDWLNSPEGKRCYEEHLLEEQKWYESQFDKNGNAIQ
tara:strand:+ start:216 stop:527 length:312 start_codon:yes stop_codon:yes gene_type:complete